METFTCVRAARRISSMRFRYALWLSGLLVLTGCMAASAPPKTTYYYTLDYASAVDGMKQQLPLTLRVERFSVSPPFHTQRIIYAGKGSQRNSYAYHQWIATPGELLPHFFVRDLRKSNGFKAVLPPDSSLSATHSLHGWVEEFIEKDNSKNWQAVATIHVSLINQLNADPTQKIMFQKRYHAAVDCNAKTPEALAQAMSEVVSQIIASVAKDLHHRLSTTGVLTY